MVPPMAKAAVAAGADAILVEIHPNADKAVSDAAQTLYLDQFEKLMGELRVIADGGGTNAVDQRVSGVRARFVASRGLS